MATYGKAIANIWPDMQSPNPLENIAAVQDVYNELHSFDDRKLGDLIELLVHSLNAKNNARTADKALLDATYRTYYKTLAVAGTTDLAILPFFDSFDPEIRPYIAHGVIFTDYHKQLEHDRLVKWCNLILDRITTYSSRCILLALRSVNMLYNKYPRSRVDFSLTRFYFCMQSQPVRDECLSFFKNWLHSQGNIREVFSMITNHWPWTNKHKFYLLCVVLNNYQLESLINFSGDIERFFEGTRLSLRYKNLLSSGQLVVKALSKQNLKTFNHFLIGIIKTGTHNELGNLNSQWMHHVRNKDELFIQLQLDQSLEAILRFHYIASDSFRLVLICTIFQKCFVKHPDFDQLVEHLQENCFLFCHEAQLYVYKFVIDSMLTSTGNNFSTKIDFILDFIREHYFVPCSDYRNTILNKLPIIFDFLAKKSIKPPKKPILVKFFGNLKMIFKDGISRSEYQSVIFNLKLFELILKCFESKSHKSLMKNSSLTMNQKLGRMLIDENIWRYQDEYAAIFNLLIDSGEFDDVRELVVKILMQLETSSLNGQFDLWKTLCEDSDINKCVLSSFYSRLSVHQNSDNAQFLNDFFEYCRSKITENLEKLENDSLYSCKQGNHIFGIFNSLNELFRNSISSRCLAMQFRKVAIELINTAVKFVLKQLNLAGNDGVNTPPSFQIIEESLEMLVLESSYVSESHSTDRKFLLLSFWMTLKACCELATTIGLLFVETSENDDQSWTLLSQCLDVHVTILHGCRHKGAIEAAGTSIGKLIKGITSLHSEQSRSYKLLFDCFSILFGSVNNISTTRRGAGLSILFHNLIKNDSQKYRPLFQHAIKILLRHIANSKAPDYKPEESDQKHDNFDALVLHYLCVLVRDSELKDCVSEYYDEIMMSAIARINENEWTIKNAALQLFGALVPKIVGQKQAAVGNDLMYWEPSEITFTEFCVKLPKTNAHILESCKEASDRRKSISSVIFFLDFLSNIEYLKKENTDEHFDFILEYRELFWRFLSHDFEKVRKLSAKCLARFHDFRHELPSFLSHSIGFVFRVQNENFVHGLVSFFIQSACKLKSELQFISNETVDQYFKEFRMIFIESYEFKRFSSYVRSYFIDLFKLLDFDFESEQVRKILCFDEYCEDNTRKNSTDMKKSSSFGIYILDDKIKGIYDNQF